MASLASSQRCEGLPSSHHVRFQESRGKGSFNSGFYGYVSNGLQEAKGSLLPTFISDMAMKAQSSWASSMTEDRCMGKTGICQPCRTGARSCLRSCTMLGAQCTATMPWDTTMLT